MASLYKRASPSQARILRIIEGSVKNACDAHAELQVSPRHRRSIAKRAAGTLSAQWPAVLAAKLSDGAAADALKPYSVSPPQVSEVGISPKSSKAKKRRRASHLRRRTPLGRLEHMLRTEMYRLKLEPNEERRLALIDVFRMISSIEKAKDG